MDLTARNRIQNSKKKKLNRVGVIFLCIKLKKETTIGLQKEKVALPVSAQKAWKMEH